MLTFEKIKDIVEDSWYYSHIVQYRKGFCFCDTKKNDTKLYYYLFNKPDYYGITCCCVLCATHFENKYKKENGLYKLIEINEKELFTINILC